VSVAPRGGKRLGAEGPVPNLDAMRSVLSDSPPASRRRHASLTRHSDRGRRETFRGDSYGRASEASIQYRGLLSGSEAMWRDRAGERSAPNRSQNKWRKTGLRPSTSRRVEDDD